LLEHAWALHGRAPLPAADAAATAFALARTRWEDGADRDRARSLARRAADLARRAETPDSEFQLEVEQWLRAHAAAGQADDPRGSTPR
jgi:hypothetical protein